VLLTGTLQGAVPHGASQERPSGYRVVLLAGLGGTSSAGHSINNRGWVTGYSDLPGDRARHAGLWKGRAAVDLGTLGRAQQRRAVAGEERPPPRHGHQPDR
jgi:probable HAF family extracellular repeat protein